MKLGDHALRIFGTGQVIMHPSKFYFRLKIIMSTTKKSYWVKFLRFEIFSRSGEKLSKFILNGPSLIFIGVARLKKLSVKIFHATILNVTKWCLVTNWLVTSSRRMYRLCPIKMLNSIANLIEKFRWGFNYSESYRPGFWNGGKMFRP